MTCYHHKTEALSPYTRDGPGGNTRTTTLQDNFGRRIRGVLRRINARIRDAIQTNDAFDLRTEALVDDVPESVFQTESTRAATARFLEWLRTQFDENYLTVVGPEANQFVRAAYAAGIREVHGQLSDLDVAFDRPDMDDMLGRPIHASALRQLYTRTYENLESVRDDTVQAVRDELVEGFRDGKSPTAIARSLTDRVDSIGKHRSTMIARSEVIRAHTEGSLTRIQEVNRDRPEQDDQLVTGHGRWNAAVGQPNTCAFCRRMNGTPLRASEMMNGVVQFRGDTYRLAPPAHVNGRCGVDVWVGGSITEPLEERLPAEVTLLT